MWRPALTNDYSSIIEMVRELYREDPSPEPVPDEHTRRTVAALRAEPARGRGVVLEIEGRVVGYALLISFWSNELGGEVCMIDELYVRPAHRSRGHGRALIEALTSGTPLWPSRPVAIDLEVTPGNSRARALYSSLGFSPAKNAHMRFRMRG